ncbi:hypothetical protein M885DRAFT_93730 [Pelagophyceae sp. CCMP2097]|nr:hypothetical protein M885DRAFT_93730 [Pelagophyceae sp. CCMP2097]
MMHTLGEGYGGKKYAHGVNVGPVLPAEVRMLEFEHEHKGQPMAPFGGALDFSDIYLPPDDERNKDARLVVVRHDSGTAQERHALGERLVAADYQRVTKVSVLQVAALDVERADVVRARDARRSVAHEDDILGAGPVRRGAPVDGAAGGRAGAGAGAGAAGVAVAGAAGRGAPGAAGAGARPLPVPPRQLPPSVYAFDAGRLVRQMEDGDAKHEPLVACIDGEALSTAAFERWGHGAGDAKAVASRFKKQKKKFEQRMPQYIAIRHYGSTETGSAQLLAIGRARRATDPLFSGFSWCAFTVHVVHEARQRAQEAPPT